MKIGLISDTHMPDRCGALPSSLFDALGGVDLLLHAGDVGDLSVLDRLSAIAPVIAVHGNDELNNAPQFLPYQQVINAAGIRIVLTHGHYPDRAEELASRRDDAWGPKLDRWAAFGQRAGATVVVFGHTHIPMALEWNGVLLINPGAIAPPNYTSRQTLQSVARLELDHEAITITHIDLAAPHLTFAPPSDISIGFGALYAHYTESILAADLIERPAILRLFHELLPEMQLRSILRRAAWPCWYGDRSHITAVNLRDALVSEPDVPEQVRTRLLAEV